LICYRDISHDEFNDLKANNNGFASEEDRKCLQTDFTAIGVFGI